MNSGVLQGEPLSGPIFTISFGNTLRGLNHSIDFDLNSEVRLNPDYVVLVAGTKRGMQWNIDKFEVITLSMGLRINAPKSLELSFVPSGCDKKMKLEVSGRWYVRRRGW